MYVILLQERHFTHILDEPRCVTRGITSPVRNPAGRINLLFFLFSNLNHFANP